MERVAKILEPRLWNGNLLAVVHTHRSDRHHRKRNIGENIFFADSSEM